MILDLNEAFQSEPEELDFIWPGFLAGTVGALVAPGGIGKSYWALEAAMTVSCGFRGGDLLKLQPTDVGRVVYLATEDPVAILRQRARAIGCHLSQEAQDNIIKRLEIHPLMGSLLNIMDPEHYSRIAAVCEGARLVIVDTLSRIHCMDENSNSDMAQLLAKLENLATVSGAAVLFLHHVNKGSARDGLTNQQQSARGASALIDNARWCGYVASMTEAEAEKLSEGNFNRKPVGRQNSHSYVRFGTSKQNYGGQLLEQWYKRREEGVLVSTDLFPTKRENTRRAPADYVG